MISSTHCAPLAEAITAGLAIYFFPQLVECAIFLELRRALWFVD